MTDRYHSLTVVLEANIRADDAQPLIDAILQLRGVLSICGEVANSNTWMAEERARRELGNKIWEVIYPKKGNDNG